MCTGLLCNKWCVTLTNTRKILRKTSYTIFIALTVHCMEAKFRACGMDKNVLSAALLLSLVRVSYQQYVATQCLVSTTPGEDLTFVFRLCPDTNMAITGLQTYDATEVGNYVTPVTGPSCSTTTFDEGAYELTIRAVTGQSTCGLAQTGTNYEFAVIAEGPGIFYRVTCNSGNLQTLPVIVTEDDYGTLHPQMHLEYNPVPVDVQFDVFAGDGTNAPVNYAYLGQKLRLQLIYNQGFEEKGTTNWGFNFHTAFPMIFKGTFEFALEIVTPGLGTLVKIEIGQAAWTQTVFVKRNRRAYVNIPSEFVTGTYDSAVWQALTDGGIKITARDDRVGVRAITTETSLKATTSTDSYIILPDELLDDTYTLSTGLANTQKGEVVLIFVESSTIVTFDFDPGAIPTTIAGETVSGTDPFTLTTGLDDNNILRLYCNNRCGRLEVNADKPFAVITGHHPTNGAVVSLGQMTPESRLGKKFVLTEFPSIPEITDDYFTVRATESGDALTSSSGQTSIRDDRDQRFNVPGSDVAVEVEADNPVSILKRVTVENAGGFRHRTTFQYPSISQWGIHYSYYASPGYTYRIHIVAKKGLTAEISQTTASPTITWDKIGDAPNFGSDLTDVVPISGSATYELYNSGQFAANEADEGLVEYRSTSPFMLIVTTLDPANDDITMNVPFGLRYPPKCTVPSPIPLNRGGHNYGNTVANNPGDNLDNDCDGKVDEEELNGQDDDSDTLIDEDVSITRNFLPLAIKVTKLEVARDPSFTGMYAQTVIENGCLTSDATGMFDDLAPFTHRTDLDSVFDDYWVLTSPVFDAFRLPGMTSLYFRVEFGFCGDTTGASDSECTNSCQTERKKRDLNDKVFSLTAQLHMKDGNMSSIQIQDDITEPHPCRLEPIFLIPVTLLLIMLLTESISICYMLVRRSQLRR